MPDAEGVDGDVLRGDETVKASRSIQRMRPGFDASNRRTRHPGSP